MRTAQRETVTGICAGNDDPPPEAGFISSGHPCHSERVVVLQLVDAGIGAADAPSLSVVSMTPACSALASRKRKSVSVLKVSSHSPPLVCW